MPEHVNLVRIPNSDLLKFMKKSMCSQDCQLPHKHFVGIVWAYNRFYLKLAKRAE